MTFEIESNGRVDHPAVAFYFRDLQDAIESLTYLPNLALSKSSKVGVPISCNS
jgi:hypothetical protein